MKSSRRHFIRTLTQGVAGAAVGGAVVSGCQKKSAEQDENPYAYDLSKLKKVDPAWMKYRELSPIAIQLEGAYALALDGGNQIYIGGESAVVAVDSTGAEINRIDVESPIKAIGMDAEGRLYLGMINHVEVWSAAGSQLQVWESLDRQAVITSIAVAGETVFIADAGNKRVLRFEKNGRFLGSIEAPKPGFIVPSPYFDLAVASDGSVWVVNPGRHTISRITTDGSLVNTWGKTSNRIEGFSGCCNPTHLTVLPNGDFVTSEKGLARVKVFDPTGTLKAVAAGPEQFDEGVTGLDLAADSEGRIMVLDPSRKQIRRFQLKEEGM